MKKILFALTSDTLQPERIKNYEAKIAETLKRGKREYIDLETYHCDNKEGLLRMCRANDVDILVASENLKGSDDLVTVLRDVKSELPSIQIFILLKEAKPVGNAFLVSLATSGIYNWIEPPYSVSDIASAIMLPKKMKDVEAFIPKIEAGKDGLVFNAVFSDKKETVEDLPDLFNDTLKNNAEQVENVKDIIKAENHENIGYSRKMESKSFGFGKKLKPKNSMAAKNLQNGDLQQNDSIKVLDEIKIDKPEIAEFKNTKNSDFSMNSFSGTADKASKDNSSQKKDSIFDSDDFSDFLKDYNKPYKDSDMKAVKEKMNISSEIPTFRKEPEKQVYNTINNEIKHPDTARRIEKPDIIKKPEKPEALLKKHDNLKENQDKEKIFEIHEPEGTDLEKYVFRCRYKKILFIRSLPFTSVIPSHIAAKMGCPLVDFNKNNPIENKQVKTLKTTINEAKIPEGSFVGEVIMGNGIEKLIPLFDKVIVILPYDIISIRQLVRKMTGIEKYDAVVDNASRGVYSYSQIIKNINIESGGKGFNNLNIVYNDCCMKEIMGNYIKGNLSMNSVDYMNSIERFISTLNEEEL